MKLRKLEIIGFKSFVDRTVIKFDHDVTGIVGPNGCGKSNIVDAIRWCMGEQSAKHLRGRAMEDVIFNGSESRGPAGFAEVTLTFENNDGAAPVEYREYAEIAVTRRLHRNGDSEYLINRTPVRLKDVTDLFLGTGAGTKAYAIIEQGKVGLIVSSKPEDRRLLIEEAAGITKYKSKRKQAERKMELTQQNLLRIGDIITELDKQVASLKRQAAKAERYLALRAELEDLQLHEASHKYLGLVAMQKYVAGALAEWSEQADLRTAALTAREAEIESLRLAAVDAEQVLERAQNAHYAKDNEVRGLEAEIARAKDAIATLRAREGDAVRELSLVSAERKALAGEQERFASDLERMRIDEQNAVESLAIEEDRLGESTARQQESDRALNVLQQQHGEAGARIARAEAGLAGFERRRNDMFARREKLQAEREDLEAQQLDRHSRVAELQRMVDELRSGKVSSQQERETLEQQLSQLKRDVLESERALDTNRSDLQRARSRMQALLEVQSRLEGVGQGVRAIVARRDPGVLGMLADFLEPPPQLTQPLAAVLGDALQCLVVSDERKALELAASLRESKKGRAAFLAVESATRTKEAKAVELPAALLESGAVLGHLIDLIRVRSGYEAIVRQVLSGIVVVRDVEGARELREAIDEEIRAIVTLEGEVFFGDGRMAAGDREQLAAGMLDGKRETRELGETVQRLDVVVTELVARHQSLRNSISESQGALEAARKGEHQRELALVGSERDLRSAEADLNRGRNRLEVVANEMQDLAETMAEAEAEQSGARGDLERALEDQRSVESRLADARMAAEEQRAELDARRQVVTERKISLARSRERTRGIESALDRLTRSAQELRERELRLDDELMTGARKQGELGGASFRFGEQLADARIEANTCRDELQRARTVYDDARQHLAVHEADLKTLRQAADTATKTRMEHELAMRENGVEMRSLLELVAEKHRGLDLRRVIGDYHLRDIPGEEQRLRIVELQSSLSRLGEVNLEARKEYEEANTRLSNFQAQKTDLDCALLDLQKAIEQMDRESRRLFKETFDAVNERFQKVFPQMFRGGSARLVMSNPEDLLETGIEIIAQPPGKKLGNIELMSGGEKALTAVSLIFSIFQIRPSPFCILDEVDAPLDEANVARYNDGIRTMTDRSQFILITHIKRTMQMVDVLYGVTMADPGVSSLTSVDLSVTERKRSATPVTAPMSGGAPAVA